MITRRQFFKLGAAAGAGLVAPFDLAGKAYASQQVPGQLPLNAGKIPQFVDPLPHFAGARVPAGGALTVSAENHVQRVLSNGTVLAGGTVGVTPGVGLTKVWAYEIKDGAGTTVLGPRSYPAFTLEATRGVSTNVTYVNNIADPYLYQLLTVDQTLHWANPNGLPHAMGVTCPLPIGYPGGRAPNTGDPAQCQYYAGAVPLSPHLHGGEVESASDGGPESWWTPGAAQKGPAWAAGASDKYFYPNMQEAGTLWFHDHALGVTRLNVYAGLAGFYLLRDGWDTGVPGTGANFPAGAYEIELAIQDRMFDTNGQWFFPDMGLNPEHPFWVPEFVGDTIVVNGRTWPFQAVEPRRYRFRLLNGSNARTYEMSLWDQQTGNPGPAIFQIGADDGLFGAPVRIDPAAVGLNKLVLMPGERADIIVDFKGYGAGTNPANGLTYSGTFIVKNNAKTPYPAGAAPQGKTVGRLMQFRVNQPLAGADTSYDPATGASLRNTPIVLLTNGAGALAPGVVPDVKRQLTLNEVMAMPMAPWPGGPLEVLVNNSKWDGTMSPGIDPLAFPDGVTEKPRVGSTEVWQIVNLTADAHPIHTHLVQFQLVSRQKLDVRKYTAAYDAAFPGGTVHGMTYAAGVFMPGYGPPNPYQTANADGALGGNPAVTPFLKGPILVPQPNEVGWKDTIMVLPGQVTTFVARWAPTDVSVGATTAGVNSFPMIQPAGEPAPRKLDPTTGPGYVWHCHIIDHEDNEMMRPQKVV